MPPLQISDWLNYDVATAERRERLQEQAEDLAPEVAAYNRTLQDPYADAEALMEQSRDEDQDWEAWL